MLTSPAAPQASYQVRPTTDPTMTAQVLDGTALSEKIRGALVARVDALAADGSRPGLTVVLVGDDPASQVYVRNKVKACERIGIRSELKTLAADTPERELLALIAGLNEDPTIHGILVQLPLPKHIDASRVIEAIALEKDVDGFHLLSAGALLTGRIDEGVGFAPCTPLGMMRMLDEAGIALAGAEAVVVGRSNTVGKPMALMLLARNATVTVCHSATRDLASVVRRADVVVAAAGKPRLITRDMIKPGATVLDVGIHRGADGKLVGDVDFAAVREVAGWISPVPGGVGPMTIAMLLSNTVLSAERATRLRRRRAA